ncbi:unnamed protein product [Echinostoma caproni]|uniref:Transposase n=1 Tax=Echinostoma caproni TaxID=27848 RepID=A0A183BA85_9TREM|nr:unnamed protein product [Echinostoma caproni]
MSNIHTHLQPLVVERSNNTGGMNVQPAKLEVDGKPIFLKRRVILYGQRDDVLQTLEKMERDGIITRFTSSAWQLQPLSRSKVTAKHRKSVAITD